MNNINEAQNDNKKRRGRPRGSKNKPKCDEKIQVENKLRSTTEKKVLVKVAKKAIKKQLDTFFVIKPRSGGKCYYQTEITVDYTPYREHETTKLSIVPKINIDNKPHIPGFIMDMDKGYYEKHDQRYKEDHEAKITDYTKPKSRLYQPKPGKRHNYCCVCKQSYEDYLEHVQSTSHKKFYNHNEFSDFIRKISKDYESNHRNNMKHQEQADLTDTQTPQEEDNDCLLLNLTDSATQKYGNKNEKTNKGSNQYNNLVYQNQMLKKTQSHINPQDQLKNNFLQKSVSVNMKGQQSNGAANYHEGMLSFQQTTQAQCLNLNTKQQSNANYQQPYQYTINSQQYYINLPNYDNELMAPDIIPNISNNNSHNNSMNNQSNNNNNAANRAIKSSYVNNASNPAINLKRKAEIVYSENLENTRKYQFTNNIKQIIDLTEEGNDQKKPAQQNNNQTRIASNGSYMMAHQYVVCND